VLPAMRGKLHHPTGFLDESREHVNYLRRWRLRLDPQEPAFPAPLSR
jgi:hypothetical protein